MKSIREWMQEKNINEDMTKLAFRNTMGGTNVQIDANLKNMLKPKIQQIVKDFEGHDPMELFRGIIAAAGSIISGMSGTKISTDRLFDKLGADNDSEDMVNKEV